MAIWDDFVASASAKVNQAIDSVAPIGGDPNTPPDIGGAISDAIYQYGRGRVDTAVQNLTAAFSKTKTGQSAIATAQQQRIQELMPLAIVAVLLVAGFMFLRGR